MLKAGGLLLIATCLMACGSGVQTGRVGNAFPLESGAPRTSCERQSWYELAPARVQTTGMEAGLGYNTHYSAVFEGVGVFRYKEDEPELVEDLWPRMKEPALQRAHVARIQPVDDANQRTLNWSLISLGGLAVGVGTAAAIQNDSPGGAAVAGISGLVVGLVGIGMALASQPSGEDQIAADARRELFFPEEDDMSAVGRGVDRINNRTRDRCTN